MRKGVSSVVLIIAVAAIVGIFGLSMLTSDGRQLSELSEITAGSGGKGGGHSKISPHGSCYATPNPVAFGDQYTVYGSGFYTYEPLVVWVQTPTGLVATTPSTDSLGNFAMTSYGTVAGNYIVSVYDSSDKKLALMTTCSFNVLPLSIPKNVININSCQAINNPGNYILTNDIAFLDSRDVLTGGCLIINASNVNLNLNGHDVSSQFNRVIDVTSWTTDIPFITNLTITNGTINRILNPSATHNPIFIGNYNGLHQNKIIISDLTIYGGDNTSASGGITALQITNSIFKNIRLYGSFNFNSLQEGMLINGNINDNNTLSNIYLQEAKCLAYDIQVTSAKGLVLDKLNGKSYGDTNLINDAGKCGVILLGTGIGGFNNITSPMISIVGYTNVLNNINTSYLRIFSNNNIVCGTALIVNDTGINNIVNGHVGNQ